MISSVNIKTIVLNRLCNSCGACVGVCVSGAIELQEDIAGHLYPVVNAGCISCGLCTKVCSGKNLSNSALKRLFDSNPFYGQALNTYVGKSIDSKLFNNSQSGGIASAIINEAISQKIIGGAVLVRMKQGNPPRPEIFIASTPEEIMSAQKSKYCPTPLFSIFQAIMKYEHKLALVGLPCHIHAFYNLSEVFKEFKDKIAFTIGLVCDRVMTYRAIDFFAAAAQIPATEPYSFDYRNKSISGYPGDICIKAQKKLKTLPAANRTLVKEFFTPLRCRICFDKMNVLSDITVCDPHGLEGIDRKNGETALIVRTKRGSEILSKISSAIDVKHCLYDDIVKGQLIDLKISQWRVYVKKFADCGFLLPHYLKRISDSISDRPVLSMCYKISFKLSLQLYRYDSLNKLLIDARRYTRKQSLYYKLTRPFSVLKAVIKNYLAR